MVLELKQKAELPANPMPIISIGLGGIVHDAHYPAYDIAGFEVIGGYDISTERATMMQEKFNLPTLYNSIADAVEQAPEQVVYDVAVPGFAILDVLNELPDESIVLIQKPMGENIEDARAILATCHQKKLKAAVNFQLRFAPYIIAARDMIDSGLLGELTDLEVRLQVNTPWHLWDFLFDLPRMEILYHSVHYIDMMRSFLGTPQSIYAKTIGHPHSATIKGGVRTMMMLDYGENPRVNIMTNHNHAYSSQFQESYIKFEGTKGAVRIRVGLLLNYPEGMPDKFEYILVDDNSEEWQTVDIDGSWFPHGFIGTMASLQRYALGETDELPTAVDDAFQTMASVEAAYESSQNGGTLIPKE